MSTKEYYQKNKEKWKVYHQTLMNDPEKHKRRNEYSKQWKKENPEKVKAQKTKDDAKYYAKMKHDPEFRRKTLESSKEYYHSHKTQHIKKMAKYRAKPEIKKKIAIYNRQWQIDNPDKLLKNLKKHLGKLGSHYNLNWIQYSDQLRSWSRIIHTDFNETCQICGKPSDQAHHIFEKAKYPDLAFNRNNGIALCEGCHYEVHGKMIVI